MIKEFQLKHNKPNVQACVLEKSLASIAEVMVFVYGNNLGYEVSSLPDDEGMWVMTTGGREKLLYGDTVIKDENGNISIQWTQVFNELYEEVTNG